MRAALAAAAVVGGLAVAVATIPRADMYLDNVLPAGLVGRAATPTPTPSVTPTPTPTPTPTLPQAPVDLPGQDAAPVEVPPADGSVPGTVASGDLPTGGMADNGTINGNGMAYDSGTAYDGGGSTYVDPGPAAGGTYSDGGGYTDPGPVYTDPGYTDPGLGYSDGGTGYSDGGYSDGGGYSNGGAMGDRGDLADTSDTADTIPLSANINPLTGLDASGYGSATAADAENASKAAPAPAPAGPQSGTAGGPNGTEAPAAVTLRSEDDKLIPTGTIPRLTALAAAFLLAGTAMTLLRRRRRPATLTGRHRAA
ncbi:hypothetical protein Asi02nite_15630 [Asanoa siamensis]|uniref:Uncharacterized protein n=1 Tax=Asanoa siamensis TaxID=926357 RepID=A0ABQ4CL94_9ACTN|nr:hypothetical protein Asi02nite_15630 [Asanoa siamensis]